jgi:hypothetical protein
MLRRGSAGSNTTADHLVLLDAAITALPPGFRRKLMVTADGAGASHGLIARLDALASRRGYELTYSVGWVLGERERAALRLVPEQAWQIAIDARGDVRERRAEAGDGWRYSLWVTNRPADTKGWLGQHAYLDAAHRVHARVEDAIRTGKDAGLGHFPLP